MRASARKQILLLEDEILIAMDLQILVEDYGCAVVGPAHTCPAALDLLKSRHVDAALLDYVIGEEYCEVVVDELFARGIPWALSTGFDVRLLHQRYRGVPLVAKPYFKRDVQLVLRQLLDPQAETRGHHL